MIGRGSQSLGSQAPGLAQRLGGMVAIVVMLAICGCSQDGAAPAQEGQPAVSMPGKTGPTPENLVLITIDTLRADRCSVYGNPHPTTPFLERLAGRGVLFEQVHATSSWTPPSMASIFTGRPPRAHGVIHGAVRDGGVFGQQFLDEGLPTIASVLAEQGFFCAGVSSNTHLSTKTGFARGFDQFVEVFWEDAESVTASARELIAAIPPGQRYFLWIHLIDPHVPYHAREPWVSTYGGDPQWVRAWGGAEVKSVRQDLRAGAAGEKAQETLLALYDSEVAYADQAIGKLLDELDSADETLVVVTSDHGEALLEHQKFGHGSTLYEEQIRVPLVIAGPGVPAGQKVTVPVSNADLMPTLLEMLGAESPQALAPASLVPLIDGMDTPARPVFTELDRNDQRVFTARQGPLKLYRRLRPRPEVYLFNLETDPREQQDLLATENEALTELMAAWRGWQEMWPAHEATGVVMGEIDSEEAEKLRSLGYLGQ